MNLITVKQYLRVDGDDEDDMIILMMEAAERFVVSAVGSYDETKATSKMLYLAALQDMYDNRKLVAVNSNGYGVSQQFRNMVTSIVLQLQADELIDESKESGDGDGV
jgi:uncharacterized phage protein (predicted DNA packaging)